MPTLPGTPPNLNRKIYEASTVAQIVSGIAGAAATCNNAVVHIQPGSYSVASTITVPANCPIQIIGDGYNSRLTWSGTGSGPVMRLVGPSKAILHDFSVSGNNHTADGIEVDNADQPGSRVFMEQATLGQSYTQLFVDGLDYTNVELHDFYNLYDWTTGNTSVKVLGGPSAAQGLWQGGATNIFAGLASGNYITYGVSNGAHVGVRGTWFDTGAGGVPFYDIADVTGPSTFTYAGSTLYIPSNPNNNTTAISLHDFRGTAGLINLKMNGQINITGNGGIGRVLGLGLVGPGTFFKNTSGPAATAGFLNGINNTDKNNYVKLSEQGCCDETFLTAALNQIRTKQPTLLAPLPSGVTDARFYRVFVDTALTGIHLEATSLASPRPRRSSPE
jgi:hypothetical protein